MKSAFLKAPFQVEIRDLPLKPMGDDEVVLKIKACGVCGSDINVAHTNKNFEPFGRFSHATPALFFPLCADLIRNGMVDVKSLISHRFSLDEMQQAMLLCRDDKENVVKVLMVND